MPRHRLVLEARCACWVPGNPRFTRTERAWAGGGFPVHADGSSVEAADRTRPGDEQKGGQHVCAGDPGPCVRRRRFACSLTDGSRRWALEPWDGLAAHLGLLTTE